MKNHKMRLHEEPFNQIKEGIKEIEYRLNDEKRQELNIGDTITFYKRPLEEEKITVEITNLVKYKNLIEMYTDTFSLYLKDYYEIPEDAVKDTNYYTDEEINKYGCLAIYIKKYKGETNEK